jgi:Kef-type K+ transport system membrane component KefB
MSEEEAHDVFHDVLYLLLFLAAAWAAGKVANLAGMPPLVGEIILGALLGPPLGNKVPFPSAVQLLGDVGLVLMARAAAASARLGAAWSCVCAACGLVTKAVMAAATRAHRERTVTDVLAPWLESADTPLRPTPYLRCAVLPLQVVEAGLEVQPAMLRQVGARSVAIAFAGSVCGPLLLGLGFSVALGSSVTEGLAVGAALSPTSMGVALVVLKRARVLNTPTGQLVVAAAVIDDVIALVLLSELRALANPSPAAFIVPIVSAVCFTLGVGAAAIYAVPSFLTRIVLPLLPKAHVEEGMIILLFGTVIGLMSALHAGQASYLLGAFLGGLCFCSLHSLHHVWTAQVKRCQTWLVRVFFAATVGFSIPIAHFWTAAVWRRGALFFVTIVAKVATGLLAKPLTLPEALTVGFAMSAWGEFAFVVALTAKNELHLMSDDTYAGVMLAVLMSVVAGPSALRAVLAWDARRTAAALAAANAATKRGIVYYKLDIRTLNRFGLMPDLLRILASDGVDVLDCRVDSQSGGRLALFEAFMKDTRLADADPSTRTAAGLGVRMAHLRTRLLEELLAHDEQASVNSATDADVDEDAAEVTVDWSSLRGLALQRWMPGHAPDEWAAAGVEGQEEQATTIMRREAALRAHGTPALRDVLFPPVIAEGGEEEQAAQVQQGLEMRTQHAGAVTAAVTPPAAHAAAADVEAPIALSDGRPSIDEGATLSGGNTDAAAEADRAVLEAAAVAEEERALRAQESEGRGLIGAVRMAPPTSLGGMETSRLIRARSVRMGSASSVPPTDHAAASPDESGPRSMRRGRSEVQPLSGRAASGGAADFAAAVAAFRQNADTAPPSPPAGDSAV